MKALPILEENAWKIEIKLCEPLLALRITEKDNAQADKIALLQIVLPEEEIHDQEAHFIKQTRTRTQTARKSGPHIPIADKSTIGLHFF